MLLGPGLWKSVINLPKFRHKTMKGKRTIKMRYRHGLSNEEKENTSDNFKLHLELTDSGIE